VNVRRPDFSAVASETARKDFTPVACTMSTPGSDRGVSFSPETRFVESLSMFGGRRTSISFEEERQHAPHRFRETPPPLRKDPSLMMFAGCR
jgi:hypothetical protein